MVIAGLVSWSESRTALRGLREELKKPNIKVPGAEAGLRAGCTQVALCVLFAMLAVRLSFARVRHPSYGLSFLAFRQCLCD